MLKNQTNSAIVGHALRGVDAQTTTGNMSTDSYRVGYSRWTPFEGQLPKVWCRVLSAAFRAGTVSQVIYSYSTPIAWKIEGRGWIIPEVTYSPTTSSKHQTHLYQLRGEHIVLPFDATEEDAQRVLDGRMEFVRGTGSRYNTVVSTRPGPNYIPGE